MRLHPPRALSLQARFSFVRLTLSPTTRRVVCVLLCSRSTLLPAVHIYFQQEQPQGRRYTRSRRYVAYQTETSEYRVASSVYREYMRNAVSAWEYTRVHMPLWEKASIKHAHYVRSPPPCARRCSSRR